MKRVFLDTNILLDLVQRRQHLNEAATILQYAYEGKIEVAASTLSFANIAYILRKLPQELFYQLMSRLSEDIPMLPLTPTDMRNAIGNPVKDFEDMLQYQCALAAGCDVIVTNNKKDFHEFCRIPFLTAEEFLLQFDYEG
ncbi:MAG: PIN domain-containing protein [Bacteroidaceae bacterium]|nr:PIN domain-containing protein [Bacteroidaceae bacterium]